LVRYASLLSVAFASACLLTPPLAGQTLPARPVPLSEPVRGGTWKDGELVLGKTTLAGARRMLATVAAAAGREKPRPLPADRVWEVGGVTLRPRWEYDPGQGYFQLFFDENERLIFALDRTDRPKVTRTQFLTHYPRALRVQQSDSFDQFQADVQPCVTLTALVDRKRDHVIQFGYAWTCRTRAMADRAETARPDGR
jgi:hypothetical protein